MRTFPRATSLAVGVLAMLLVALALAQLVLPGIAAERMREEIGRYGTVRSASVSAFPAIELLWRHGQSASATAGSLAMSVAQASALLWKARGIERIDLHAGTLHFGPITMQAASMRKRGDRLLASGNVTEADLRAMIPSSTGVRILGNTAGGIAIRVSGSAFGPTPSIEVLLAAHEGELVAQPQGIPFAGGLGVTIIADPHIHVQSLSLADPASASSAAGPASYRLALTATLR